MKAYFSCKIYALSLLKFYLHTFPVYSLKYINVAMVTVLKNVTNVITAVGEMYLFQKHHDSRVWAALFLMVCCSDLLDKFSIVISNFKVNLSSASVVF